MRELISLLVKLEIGQPPFAEYYGDGIRYLLDLRLEQVVNAVVLLLDV